MSRARIITRASGLHYISSEMLYKESVEPRTLSLILRLLQDETFRDFYLAGGTALSLQIGHRLSTDLDLLSKSNFDAAKLSDYLSNTYHAETIKVLSHPFPLIKPLITLEGLRMASPEDLGAITLYSIIEDGSRFINFIDLYSLLEHLSLEELTDAYETKYPKVNRSAAHKALMHQKDIIPVPVNFTGHTITLKDIAYRLRKAVQEPKRIFESGPTEWQTANTAKAAKTSKRTK